SPIAAPGETPPILHPKTTPGWRNSTPAVPQATDPARKTPVPAAILASAPFGQSAPDPPARADDSGDSWCQSDRRPETHNNPAPGQPAERLLRPQPTDAPRLSAPELVPANTASGHCCEAPLASRQWHLARQPSHPCARQLAPAIRASYHPPAHLAPAATTPWHQDESWWPGTKPAFVSVELAPRNQTTKTAGIPAKSQQPLQYPGESDASTPEARSGASIPSPAGTVWFSPT